MDSKVCSLWSPFLPVIKPGDVLPKKKQTKKRIISQQQGKCRQETYGADYCRSRDSRSAARGASEHELTEVRKVVMMKSYEDNPRGTDAGTKLYVKGALGDISRN